MKRTKFTTIHRLISALGCIVAFTLAPAIAQQHDSLLSKLRALHLKEEPGPVPVIYPPSAEERALKYRDSLQIAHAWYEEQLGIQVPLTLVVLDQQTWDRSPDNWPMPHANTSEHLVIFPSRIEEYPSYKPATPLAGEEILFHEAGHVFAHALKIGSGNSWVNELVANMFVAAYVERKRPDLMGTLRPEDSPDKMRYTSLADLDYLYSRVGFQNYRWFQLKLKPIAAALVEDQKFAKVIAKLQEAFPANEQKQESVATILRKHLSTIRPFDEWIPPNELLGPATLPSIQPTQCTEVSGSPKGVLVIRNETGKPLEVNAPRGPVTIAAGGWQRLALEARESAKLPDGKCLVPAAEPGVALIAKPEDRWAEIPGARIHYTDGGNGEPVILLHANTGSTESWVNQIPAFVKAGFRVIAYDRRGFGLTTAVSSDSTDADDLAALLDALHLDRAHLVGTAAGGGVALDFTISFPGRVLRLVDADSTGASKDSLVAEMRARISSGVRPPLPRQFAELSPSYRASAPEGTRRWIEILDRASGAFFQRNRRSKSPMTLTECEKIQTPTLLITGGADLAAPPPLIELMAAHIPNSKVLVIHDAGHSAFWEQPEVFNRAVLGFLTKR